MLGEVRCQNMAVICEVDTLWLGLPALSALCEVQDVAGVLGCYWSGDSFVKALKWPEIVKFDELKLLLES